MEHKILLDDYKVRPELYKHRLKVKGNILVFMSNENDTQKSKLITPSLLIVRAQNYWCICVK